MKRLLFFLLITPFFLAAQNGDPVADTSYLVQQGASFYEVRTTFYPDGEEVTYKDFIGDTSALVEGMKSRITSKAASLAVDVLYTSTAKKQLTGLIREANAVLTLTGIDPMQGVQDDHVAPFLADGWTIKRDDVTSPLVFTVNAQNNLRYAVNGGATKAANLFGRVIRLRNYPSNGTDTDMFVMKNGNYVNLDRSTVLRPPGNNNPVNRSAEPPPVSVPKAAKKKG